MTIKFLIVANSMPSDALMPIYVRLINSKFYDKKVKTNLVIKQDLWDAKREIIRPRVLCDENLRIEVNNEITKIRDFISTKFFLEKNPHELPATWLADCLNIYYKKKDKPIKSKEKKVVERSVPISKLRDTEFFRLYNSFQERQDISESRARQYKVLNCTLERFQLFVRTTKPQKAKFTIELNKIDSDFLREFYDYMENEHIIFDKYPEIFASLKKKKAPLPRSKNTMTDLFKKFRAFLNWCYSNNYMDNKPFEKFKLVTETYGTPYYLTLEELKQIYQADLSKDPILNTQKDVFVFQCCIGCRVGDLLRLKKTDIINGNIEYIPHKTIKGSGNTVVVPLNKMAREIVDKYFMFFDSQLLPFTDPQKYNAAIKIILEKCEITRMVTILDPLTRSEKKVPINEVATSHMARRTFIGNIYKKVKDPNLVASLTGHSEGSKAFSRYRDIDTEMKKELVSLLD